MSEPKPGDVRHEMETRDVDGRTEVVDQRRLVWTGEEWVDVMELVNFWNET